MSDQHKLLTDHLGSFFLLAYLISCLKMMASNSLQPGSGLPGHLIYNGMGNL